MSEGNSFAGETRLDEPRNYWDQEAASFDREPDHGLHPPRVRQAWTKLLKTWLPSHAASVLDVGCGTGSLSVVMAGFGHQVTGIDLSPAMIEQAQAKAVSQGQSIEFQVMDAAAPQFPPGTFEVIVCRHLLWAFPEPARVLQHWVGLLKPGGRLLLIEGYWDIGSGLHASEIEAMLPPRVTVVLVQDLSGQPDYWGKEVTDERFAMIADLC